MKQDKSTDPIIFQLFFFYFFNIKSLVLRIKTFANVKISVIYYIYLQFFLFFFSLRITKLNVKKYISQNDNNDKFKNIFFVYKQK